MNEATRAIQEQLVDAHEAAHHLTIQAEQDVEREEQWEDEALNHYGDFLDMMPTSQEFYEFKW